MSSRTSKHRRIKLQHVTKEKRFISSYEGTNYM